MARPPAEVPTITKKINDPLSESVETHPSYAQIAANRTTGGQQHLYGSDFVHHNYITIRIGSSELHRGLSHDWAFGPLRGEYIEVALSEAQWATFVSTPNSGMGTQCTLTAKDGVAVPSIARVVNRTEQFSDEASARLADGMKKLDEVCAAIEASSLSAKAKRELEGLVWQAANQFGSNIAFVGKSFAEHVERTTEKAKIEISAYAEHVIRRTGLDALRGAVPFSLPDADPAALPDEEPR